MTVGSRRLATRSRPRGSEIRIEAVPWHISNLSLEDGCHYCGAPADTWDHVVPRSAAGDDDYRNLVPCCSRCNSLKGNRPVTWLVRRLADKGIQQLHGQLQPQDVAGRASFGIARGFISFDAPADDLHLTDLDSFLSHQWMGMAFPRRLDRTGVPARALVRVCNDAAARMQFIPQGDPESLRRLIRAEHDTLGRSWDEVAKARGISKGTVFRFAVEGHEPKRNDIRTALGLGRLVDMLYVGPGQPPQDGAQIGVDPQPCRTCRSLFVSNHPRRLDCFTCSPPHLRRRS